jgi:hypothetical protein
VTIGQCDAHKVATARSYRHSLASKKGANDGMTSPRYSTAIPTAALTLSILGLLPFIGLMLAPLWGLEPFGRPPLVVLALYAAINLSFMGAIHWGLAMGEFGGRRDASWTYVASICPALIGWFALAFFPQAFAMRLMAAAFVLLLAYDIGAVRRGFAPAWYTHLRWPLTLVVVVCLFLASILT